MTMVTGQDNDGDDIVAIEEDTAHLEGQQQQQQQQYPELLSTSERGKLLPEEELIKLYYSIDYEEQRDVGNRKPSRKRRRRNRQRPNEQLQTMVALEKGTPRVATGNRETNRGKSMRAV